MRGIAASGPISALARLLLLLQARASHPQTQPRRAHQSGQAALRPSARPLRQEITQAGKSALRDDAPCILDVLAEGTAALLAILDIPLHSGGCCLPKLRGIELAGDIRDLQTVERLEQNLLTNSATDSSTP